MKVMMTIELLFTVPDDLDVCNSTDKDQLLCDGDCGGECDQYFWACVSRWLNNDHTQGKLTEYVSMSLEHYEDPPELDCRNYPI